MGWIDYDGQGVLITYAARVDVTLRGGRFLENMSAGGLRWTSTNSNSDIVKFRVVSGSVDVEGGCKVLEEVKEDPRYNPIDTRDRIEYIDAQIKLMTEERVTLVNLLLENGFYLKLSEPVNIDYSKGNLFVLISKDHTGQTAMKIGEVACVTGVSANDTNRLILAGTYVVHKKDLKPVN